MDFIPFDPDAEVKRGRRYLPHWEQSRRTYFVTFRLGDSIPKDKLDGWREAKAQWEEAHPKPWSGKEWKTYRDEFLDRIERWSDKGYGECLLRTPDLRKIVADSLLFFAGEPDDDKTRYQMGDFVLMPNHVHLLVTPHSGWKLGQLIHSWKSFTAHQINKAAGRTSTLWMDERFDHLVRNSPSLNKFQSYIAANPHKANLPVSDFTLWTKT